MTPEAPLDALKSLRLFAGVPEAKLRVLAERLEPLRLKDGERIFAQGSPGDSLYFVAAGAVRIDKPATGGERKTLACLEAGDFFGEMALLESARRSADAWALGDTLLLELKREPLDLWLKSDPALAAAFFAQLAQTLSRRLRHSSAELALLHDLSRLLPEPFESCAQFLVKAVERLAAHLEGFCVRAYLFNPFTEEMELCASSGEALGGPPPSPWPESSARWLSEEAYRFPLLGEHRLLGYLVAQTASAPHSEERRELERLLAPVGRLCAAALDATLRRQEERLRNRLSENRGEEA